MQLSQESVLAHTNEQGGGVYSMQIQQRGLANLGRCSLPGSRGAVSGYKHPERRALLWTFAAHIYTWTRKRGFASSL